VAKPKTQRIPLHVFATQMAKGFDEETEGYAAAAGDIEVEESVRSYWVARGASVQAAHIAGILTYLTKKFGAATAYTPEQYREASEAIKMAMMGASDAANQD
jgi:hypothetical protein